MKHDIEIASILKKTATETVFKGAGRSHFSFVEGKGFHATTEVPGLDLGRRYAEHDTFYGEHKRLPVCRHGKQPSQCWACRGY